MGDIELKAVKIAKAINLIVGDGRSHVFKDNSLAPHTWEDDTKAGLRTRLLRFPKDTDKDRENQDKFLFFDFDVLMTNPPFAGTVKKEDIRDVVRYYYLMEKNGRYINKIGRHILFLERSLHYIHPGGRMAIVLPQGLLNNTNAEYIRRFVIEEARILAVVGLHGNSFKPHTGTKTSVLFLQKYTEEEKEGIEKSKAKYEGEWDDFISKLKKKHEKTDWETSVDEGKLPEELCSFLEVFFEEREEVEAIESEDAEEDGEGEAEEEEKKGKKPLAELIQEKNELEETLKGNEEELKEIEDNNKKKDLKKQIRTLNSKIKKLIKEISERTLGGQIYLTLNVDKITNQLKKFWLDSKIIKEIDYPIFFAVNQKPLKDNKGEYRHIKGDNGEFEMDDYGHPLIDHDLDEIAEDFKKFAQKEELGFWS